MSLNVSNGTFPNRSRMLDPHFYCAVISLFFFLVFDESALAAIQAVYKSPDGGHSWQKADEGLAATNRINAITLFKDILFAATDGGIFRSSDQAQSWESVHVNERILSVAAHGDFIFAGVDNHGLLRSKDKGKTWSPVTTFQAKKARCFHSFEEMLYVGTDRQGVWGSSDSGTNWIQLSKHFPENAQVFSLSSVNGRLFAGLYQNGLVAWTSFETGWKKMGSVTPLALAEIDGTLVVGHNPGGIYWSQDQGISWSKGHDKASNSLEPTLEPAPLELDDNAPVWEMASGNGFIIAGASTGIFVSEDRGHTWQNSWKGLPLDAPGVSFLITKDFVYAGLTVN